MKKDKIKKITPTRSFHYPEIIKKQLMELSKNNGESVSSVIKRAISEMYHRSKSTNE